MASTGPTPAAVAEADVSCEIPGRADDGIAESCRAGPLRTHWHPARLGPIGPPRASPWPIRHANRRANITESGFNELAASETRPSVQAGEVARLPELGDAQFHRPHPGVPISAAIAVAVGDPVRVSLSVLGADLRRHVGIRPCRGTGQAMMPSTRTRWASRRKSTSPYTPRLRSSSNKSMLFLAVAVLLHRVRCCSDEDDAVASSCHLVSVTPCAGTLLPNLGFRTPSARDVDQQILPEMAEFIIVQ